MTYDVVVVGGGIAGLTASAYLSGKGIKILLCEKEERVGGLVSTFEKDGFRYDGGIRAIEDAGIMFPMLKQLDLDVKFVRSLVSLGLGKDIINIETPAGVDEYRSFLNRNFPGCETDVDEIIRQVKLIMGHMKVLYGIENPAFFDLKRDKEYLRKTLLPWMVKFLLTKGKISRLNVPVDEFLKRRVGNQGLIDFVIQHFFKKTPTFFAMSYFSLYLDYVYPLGGTGVLVDKLKERFTSNGGKLKLNTKITRIEPSRRVATDTVGESYAYSKLLWAADIKTLYDVVDIDGISDGRMKRQTEDRKTFIAEKRGGDSIFTLYLAVDLNPEYFKNISNGHFFYTPQNLGLSTMDSLEIEKLLAGARETVESARENSLEILKKWLEDFFALTTYEISIPVLRDPAMAPPGKTGLIISVLFDYDLACLAEKLHWYDEFKQYCEETIIQVLTESIYPEIQENIIHSFSSTPLTLARVSGNSDGAITGWAFTNKPVPAENRQLKITRSILTTIPDVYQAGQWTFSPSGLPIAILTGKLAADRIAKVLK